MSIEIDGQIYDYERDLRIESDALDIEWLKQPGLYMKWAELLANAEEKTRRAKENLKLIDAIIDAEIRASGLQKITEGFIKSEIERDGRHQEAIEKLNSYQKISDILSAAVKAMDMRKHALENEVRLFIGKYYSGPSEPRDLEHEVSMRDINLNKIESGIREQVRENFKNEGE